MFFPKFVEDLRAAPGVIPEERNAGGALDHPNEFLWKMRKCRKRLLQHDAGNLPMSSGRVLPCGTCAHPPETRPRLSLLTQNTQEAERIEIRQIQFRDSLQNMSQGIRANVAVSRCIRRVTNAHAVENQNESAHEEKDEGRTIKEEVGNLRPWNFFLLTSSFS